MADTRNTRPNAAAQFHAKGYVLSEDKEYGLRDLFTAMEFVGDALQSDGLNGDNFEIFGEPAGALLRTFARLGNLLIAEAPITKGEALVVSTH